MHRSAHGAGGGRPPRSACAHRRHASAPAPRTIRPPASPPALAARVVLLVALLAVRAAPVAAAGAGAPSFADGFEPVPEVAVDEAAAARFLDQATFGGTLPEIRALAGARYGDWIDAQLALPPTLARPFLEALAVTENLAGRSLLPPHRIHRWFDTAVTAPDQLRQKVAYALSQLIVVSDQDPMLFEAVIMLAEWNDLLVRNALGNFRTLLGEVARSPMMGVYLSHLRNRRFEVAPRCADQRPPVDDDRGAYRACDSPEATNGGALEPVIVAYEPPPSGLLAPDENFAREVMQLFSIGLVERELDFTPIELAGEPVPTYDQAMVSDLARVLTGLGFACSGPRTVAGQAIDRTCGCTGLDCRFSIGAFASNPPALRLNGELGLVHPDRYEPLVCYPRFHDTGRDRAGYQLPGPAGDDPVGATIALAPGETIPAGTPAAAKSLVLGGAELARIEELSPGASPPTAPGCAAFDLSRADREACVAYCDASLDTALDVLFEHPNTAAMVARHLIQRLVTSNPRPGYVRRVAAAFVDDGTGTRGNLAAVVRAVLLDDDARRAPRRVVPGLADGKPREPMLKLVKLWRAVGAVSSTRRADDYRQWPAFSSACGAIRWPFCAYLQRPLGAPSVFNFYAPDYPQPGPVAEAGLVSPELQIVNEASSIAAANDLYRQLCIGWGDDDCHGPFRGAPRSAAYFPPAALEALPGAGCGTACTAEDDATLIDTLDLLLLAGTLSGELAAPDEPASAANSGMRGTLFRLLRSAFGRDGPAALGPEGATDARARAVLYLLHLVAISPEFARRR